MLTPKTERELRNLGLNLYEVKIWAALLSRGVSTAGELSDIANVPRSRSYDVLESLEKKGFVTSRAGKPVQYIATPPSEAIEKTKKKTQEAAKAEITSLACLKGSKFLVELKTIHSQGLKLVKSADLSGSLKGAANINNHMKNMLNVAKEKVTIATTQKGLEKLAKNFSGLFEKLSKRKIRIRILVQMAKATQTKRLAGIAEIIATNNKARFCIVDSKEIIFMVLDDNEVHPTYDVGIWVNTPLAKDIEAACLGRTTPQ